MANPFVHALVFAAAVLIPGGLLVYFAWRAISLKREANHTAQKQGSGNIPDDPPSPDDARRAFEDMFPRDSLRAQNRKRKLTRAKALRHRKFKK